MYITVTVSVSPGGGREKISGRYFLGCGCLFIDPISNRLQVLRTEQTIKEILARDGHARFFSRFHADTGTGLQIPKKANIVR